jgi:hypothetical protein
MFSSFLLGAISAGAVAFTLGVRVQPKLLTDRLAQTEIHQESDPAAISRLKRSDRAVATLSVTNNLAKTSYEAMVDPAQGRQEPESQAASAETAEAVAPDVIPDVGEDLLPEENYNEAPSVSGAETPEKTGKRVMPSLYFDKAKGQRVIGNFQTRSFPGESETCSEIGETMAKDASGSTGALQTLADTSAITVLRICAANGSVILTCRAGQVTISPRQARPDDKCGDYRTHRVADTTN